MRTLFEAEHDAFRESFSAWVANEVSPHYMEWERAGLTPREMFSSAGKYGFVGIAIPEEYGGGGSHDFRFNQVIAEEFAAAGIGGSGLGAHAPQRRVHAVLPRVLQRRAAPALVARHRLGRADHRGRDDRAGHRIRSGRHRHHRRPRRRRVRAQRLEDVHHQRHQRRPRDRRRQDRPDAAPHRDVAAGRRARHARLRARPQPREGRAAQPGHGRAVLQRRAGARRQPARRGGARVSGTCPTTSPRSGCRSRSRACRWLARRSAGRSTTSRSAPRSARRSASFQNTKFVLAEVKTEVDVAQAYVDQCVLALNAGTLAGVRGGGGEAVRDRAADSG